MTTVQEIEQAVTHLPRKELVTFRSWFEEFDAQDWDRQFERDVKEGRLDAMVAEALRDLDEGRCTPL